MLRPLLNGGRFTAAIAITFNEFFAKIENVIYRNITGRNNRTGRQAYDTDNFALPVVKAGVAIG
jgi:hypothetical protein